MTASTSRRVASPTPCARFQSAVGNVEQLGDGAEAESIERAGRRGREAEVDDRSREVGGVEDPFARRDVGLARLAILARRWAHGGGEHRSPGLAHLVGRVEPVGGPPVKCLGEEGDQPVADGGVEQLRVEARDLVGKVDRIGPTVAPDGADAGGHLVKRRRRGVAVGGRVPPLARALGQEGVEVAGRAGLQRWCRVSGRARSRRGRGAGSGRRAAGARRGCRA